MEFALSVMDHLDERQFILTVRRLADALSYGADASPFLGSGIDFAQSRLYQPGDPVKSIDWRLTARTGKAYVKEYEAPKRMPIYLLIDTSASMCVSSRRISKYAWAVQLAGALALAGVNRLSPVGLIGCGQRDLVIRPSLSRQVIMQWLFQLRRYRTDEITQLATSLRMAETLMSTRSLLIVLSDLHDPGAMSPLKSLATQHDCIVLQLHDPAEAGHVGGGLFRASEAETSHSFVAHGRSRWNDPDANVQAFRKAGIDHLLCSLNENFVPRLRALLRRRDCLGRLAR